MLKFENAFVPVRFGLPTILKRCFPLQKTDLYENALQSEVVHTNPYEKKMRFQII